MHGKARLTVTVDADILVEANRSVAAGRTRSLSNWVNQALLERVATERRLAAMADAVAVYEAKHGTLTAAEIETQRRSDAAKAIVVRGPRPASAGRRRGTTA